MASGSSATRDAEPPRRDFFERKVCNLLGGWRSAARAPSALALQTTRGTPEPARLAQSGSLNRSVWGGLVVEFAVVGAARGAACVGAGGLRQRLRFGCAELRTAADEPSSANGAVSSSGWIEPAGSSRGVA